MLQFSGCWTDSPTAHEQFLKFFPCTFEFIVEYLQSAGYSLKSRKLEKIQRQRKRGRAERRWDGAEQDEGLARVQKKHHSNTYFWYSSHSQFCCCLWSCEFLFPFASLYCTERIKADRYFLLTDLQTIYSKLARQIKYVTVSLTGNEGLKAPEVHGAQTQDHLQYLFAFTASHYNL